MAIFEFLSLLVIFLFSVIIHEVSHGLTAYYLGDPTAKRAGRLTFNPIPHLDPVGSIMIPGFLLLLNLASGGSTIIFGWAKPVPINPHNFSDQKYGELKVSAAGPGINLLVALIVGTLIRLTPFFRNIIPANLHFFINGFLSVAVPLVLINIVLGVFNLLPIPPLDGSHILFTFLPRSMNSIKRALQRHGMIFLLIFVFFLYPLIIPVISFLFFLFTGNNLNL